MIDRQLPRIDDRQTVASEVVTSMPEPGDQTCEVKIEGVWQAVSLPDAHGRHRDDDKRCSACHGRVIVAGTYSGPFKLILSHRRSHDGCPTSPRSFKGTASPHPQAMA